MATGLVSVFGFRRGGFGRSCRRLRLRHGVGVGRAGVRRGKPEVGLKEIRERARREQHFHQQRQQLTLRGHDTHAIEEIICIRQVLRTRTA